MAVIVRLAIWGKLGMPSSMAVSRRWIALSIWVSMSLAAARLTRSPSASPTQPLRCGACDEDVDQALSLVEVDSKEWAADAPLTELTAQFG